MPIQWKFNDKKEKSKCRELMERACRSSPAYHHIPTWKRNDALDQMLDALSRTKMELTPIEEVEVEEEVIPFQDIFRKYLEFQTKSRFFRS